MTKTTFQVRGRAYEISIQPIGKPEGEGFEPYQAVVSGPGGIGVSGTLNLTASALDAARERAEKEGGSTDDWLARGCARSLAAEVLIRKLKPDFSFIVDHRWVQG